MSNNITYIHPSQKHFIAQVHYNNKLDGTPSEYEYIVGMYTSGKNKISLVGLENKDTVELNNDEYKKIVFVSSKKEDQ